MKAPRTRWMDGAGGLWCARLTLGWPHPEPWCVHRTLRCAPPEPGCAPLTPGCPHFAPWCALPRLPYPYREPGCAHRTRGSLHPEPGCAHLALGCPYLTPGCAHPVRVRAPRSKLIAGTQKHYPSGSLSFGNATYTTASLVTLLQSVEQAMTAHDAAVVAAKDALLALRDVMTKVGPVLRAYRKFLVATFEGSTQSLADFGMKPPKARTPLTGEQLVTKAQRAEATREARGTKGPKARAVIHGTPPAPAEPSTATTTPAPAPVPPKPPTG